MERTASPTQSSLMQDQNSSPSAPTKEPYVSHTPDSNGFIQYSQPENEMWHALLSRQEKQIPNRLFRILLANH